MMVSDKDWTEHQVEFNVFKSKVENFMVEDKEIHEKLLSKLDTLHNQVSLARHFLLFLKALGYTLIFLLAFKFGDIKTLWSNLFH